ncbi:MarR family transcriptional regulator [Novosphingobium profundi]|nr:MarR family transcriptional regulator [Novosphingobium profundi]
MCQSTCKTMKSLFFKGDTIQRQISIRLTVLARLLRNNFDRKVSALNGSLSQWTMIGIAARYPGATQRTLAEHLGISEASAGRLIDKLCTEGLLERADREDDRRARAVHVTDAARPLLETIGQIATESEEKIFKGFSHEELEQMRDFLDRIYANAGKG